MRAKTHFSTRLIAISVSLLALVGCSGDGGGSDDPEASAALGTAEPASLEAYLREALAIEVITEMVDAETDPPYSFNLDTAVLRTSLATSSASETSTTNLQVAGVDEADRVKTARGHLYIAQEQSTHLGWDGLMIRPILNPSGAVIALRPATSTALVLDASFEGEIPEPEPARIRVMALDEAGASAEEVATIELSELGTNIEGLYFLDATDTDPVDRLIVITTGSPFGAYAPDYRRSAHWEAGRTSVHWIDVTDPSEPHELSRITFQGRIVTSRRIGDRLSIVSRHRPSLPVDPWPTTREAAEDNARLLASASLESLLPTVRIDDQIEDRLVAPRDCTIARDAAAAIPTPALTTVTQISLRGRPTQRSACLAGSVESFYASTESIYLSAVDRGDFSSLLLHKFALTPRGPEFRGTGSVAGQIWGGGSGTSFQIGEHDGVVGVLSTLYQSHPDFNVWGGGGRYEHRLTILGEADGTDPALQELSRLPNEREPAAIGKPDELLHGVRFMGDRVYVVTFRQVDPLYILDIADPRNPRIAGEVEIPGFSDYLHPIGTDLLIGVGRDTAAGVANNWLQGVKVELFDVSDPTTLRSLDAEIIGKRSSSSSALDDHHAFTFLAGGAGQPDGEPDDGRVDRFAIPIENYDTLPEGGDPDEPTQYYEWTHTGLYLFELIHGGEPRIEGVGSVVAEEPSEEVRYGSRTHGDRSVIQGDAVHYVHGGDVWSAFWDTPGEAIGPQ